MRIGTKSVLFGAHCFFLHPWFVAWGWWKLYGFPWDPRLWVAFFVHDLGYWGKSNMDGEEGELHPIWGANFMYFWFGQHWYMFVRYHSRYLAKKDKQPYSLLCVADKLAISLTPAWLYLPMVRATGEIEEYMKDAKTKHADMPSDLTSEQTWYTGVQDYCRRWAYNHRDGREDTWTSERRETLNEDGVWR